MPRVAQDAVGEAISIREMMRVGGDDGSERERRPAEMMRVLRWARPGRRRRGAAAASATRMDAERLGGGRKGPGRRGGSVGGLACFGRPAVHVSARLGFTRIDSDRLELIRIEGGRRRRRTGEDLGAVAEGGVVVAGVAVGGRGRALVLEGVADCAYIYIYIYIYI